MKVEIRNHKVVDYASIEMNDDACVIYIRTFEKGVYYNNVTTGTIIDNDKLIKTLSFEFYPEDDYSNRDHVMLIAESIEDVDILNRHIFDLINKNEIIILIPKEKVWITQRSKSC